MIESCSYRTTRRLLLTAAFAGALLVPQGVRADDLTWTGFAGSLWDDSFSFPVYLSNWSAFDIAGAGDNVFFKEGALRHTVGINGNRTVSSVTIEGAEDYSLNNYLGGGILSIQTGNLTATGGGGHALDLPIDLPVHATWDIGYGTSVTTRGIHTSSSTATTFTKNGAGELVFSNVSQQGATVINQGTFHVAGDYGLGVAGADLTLGAGATLSVSHGDYGRGRNLTLLAGGEATLEVRGSSSNTRWFAPIDGAGGIHKTGPGSLSLFSSNTNTGRSTVSEGTVFLWSNLGGDLRVDGGQLRFLHNNQTPGDTDLTYTNGTVWLEDTSQRFNTLKTVSNDFLRTRNATLHADTLEPITGTFTLNADSASGVNLSTNHVLGTLAQNTGNFSPGDGIGSATIQGDYLLTTGTLTIALAGTTPGTGHDEVIIAGDLILGDATALDAVFIDDFAASSGDSFDILDFTTVSGTFGTLNLASLDPGLAWDTTSLYNDGSISVFTIGDLNGDGALTNADIAPFVQALTDPAGYQSTYPGLDPDLLGDFTGDGQLTNGDIAGFVAALTGGGAGSALVPEPTSLALLGLGGLLVSRRRAVR